jgi:3-(3-hydroxy-phenyl)propionate hydroxylase
MEKVKSVEIKPDHTYPVVIVGAGPVGMTLAALLKKYGLNPLVIEADSGYCTGSRAICVSRRSQEILSWIGAEAALRAKGLPWSGGTSFFQNSEVLNFQMPSESTQRFAPMLNIQQFYIEEFAHIAGEFQVAWNCKVTQVQAHEAHTDLQVQLSDRKLVSIQAQWLIACDGGRSTVREQLGLGLEGVQYEGRYVIVDIEQNTQRAVERLAWFDPPSNPGSTILMHRQPDNVWRIDYQVGDDEDPIEAVKPENVLPRVQSHLSMIGENAPWKVQWISIYNAKCLTLADYQHKKIFFAGDAAHLVPIFGVRGLNSGVDDAANLAWKLAAVMKGHASPKLLKTYTQERLQATRENIAYGAKSTEFMAPPHAGFKLMREAALRLALENKTISSLINPRQSLPIEYISTHLNASVLPSDETALRPGMPAPEALFFYNARHCSHLSQCFGDGFVVLHFYNQDMPNKAPVSQLAEVISVGTEHVQAWRRYCAQDGSIFLVRPDGYLMACWQLADQQSLDIDKIIREKLN